MKKLIIILFLILGLLPLHAATTPRLTVFVVVDGLDGTVMNEMRDFWSQGGLRMLQEEALQTEVSFPHLVWGGEESLATIMTGQVPAYHGYTSDIYFSRNDRKPHHRLEANDIRGINTTKKISPAALLSTTLTDGYRLRYGNDAQIYAIGSDPAATILLAGHAANGCCWLEPADNGWASTSYYPAGLPGSAYKMNASSRLSELTSTPWTNRIEIGSYLHPTAEEKKRGGFSFDILKCLLRSPVANTLVTELALALQKDKNLGQDPTPDLLLLHYNVLSPNAVCSKVRSAEQEDLYIRLNQDLGYLIEQLERRIGKDNLRIVVIGRPVIGTPMADLTAASIPHGEVNIDRAAALAGTYLMALYGHERWVDGGFGNSIYLNRRLIEQKKMSLELLRQQVADFLSEMAGIQAARPASVVELLPGDGERAKIRNSYCHTDGDVIIELQEGWQLLNTDHSPADHVLDRDPRVPLYIWSGARLSYPGLDMPLSATAVRSLIEQ